MVEVLSLPEESMEKIIIGTAIVLLQRGGCVVAGEFIGLKWEG